MSTSTLTTVGPFVNEPITDYRKPENVRGMREAIGKVRAQLGREYDLVIGGKHVRTTDKIVSINPADPSEVVGIHQKAGLEHVEPAMEAALAWYRARGERQPLGPIAVPTLYVWGDADDTVGRAAAEGTGEFIAAPYRFEALSGVGHYAADQVPERVTGLLLEHLARHPI